jgi:NAD-dependent dihydropyrimidine dehydrogenase PreA subunit
VQIDTELCAGCGACVEACPNEAILLKGNIATIDVRRCDQCGVCLEVCPTGALTSSELITMPVSAQPMTIVEPEHPAPAPARLMPLIGSGLAYLGREIGPRLVDIFINALERRLDRPPTTIVATNSVGGGSGLRSHISRRQVRRRKRQRASRRS